MKSARLILSVSMLSVTPPTEASVEIVCPSRIEVTEAVLPTDSSWSVILDQGERGYLLESMRVYSGHPHNLGNLIPDETTTGNGQRKYLWHLNNEDFWVACVYSNTRSLLAKQLPNDLSVCELTEKTLPTGAKLRIERFACR